MDRGFKKIRGRYRTYSIEINIAAGFSLTNTSSNEMVKRRINTFYPSQACYTITEESIDSTVFRKYRQNRYKPELIEDDVFRIIIPLDNVAAEEVKEQKTSSEREQKNIIWFAKIKKVTGAMYDKKTSTWIL